MYEVLKKILFLFGAQRVHKALEFCAPSLSYCPFLMNFVAKRCIFSDAILEQKIFEQDFLNPVGIAGGFDKSAKMLRLLTYIGFGFLNLATITPKAQKASAQDELDLSSFSSIDAQKMQERLLDLTPFVLPLGIGIAQDEHPNDASVYKELTQRFKEQTSYFIIDLSLPNSQEYKLFLDGDFAHNLLQELRQISPKPMLLKFSADLGQELAKDLCAKAVEAGIDGIIISDTSAELDLIKQAQQEDLDAQKSKENGFEFFKS
ncbi:MAG: hypothetical protein CSA19_00985, partial [Deltaproteobacteria bacterium]